GLSRISELMRLLGDPQKNLKFVHIAGTNGKGSTAAMLANILKEAGYTTGLYISPFLYNFNELIQVDNVPVSDEEIIFLVDEIKKFELPDAPTEYEIITAMAFLYFWKKNCDIVVLEVGMGGRLDSTNVIDSPEVAVITAIGLDHTAQLGDSVEKIAREKAGIIKKNCAVVCHPQTASVEKIIREKCAETNSFVTFADDGAIFLVQNNSDGQIFLYEREHAGRADDKIFSHEREHAGRTDDKIFSHERERAVCADDKIFSHERERAGRANDKIFSRECEKKMQAGQVSDKKNFSNSEQIFGDVARANPHHESRACNAEDNSPHENRAGQALGAIKIPLLGEHQLRNAAVVLETIYTLRRKGWGISDDAVRNGFGTTIWRGRFEIMRREPVFIIDAAHNSQGIQATLDGLKKIFPAQKFIFIFGVLADKDFEQMLDILIPHTKKIFFVTPENSRALPAHALRASVFAGFSEKNLTFSLCENVRKHSVVCKTIPDAIHSALEYAQNNDIICALGSLSLAGTVRRFFAE
ncbi:MAG: bifunctional folylpolyglutamate synthase/dihydrofolate synthase, partial [Defluviitaleaceae bacterium]|nr:bifunctional folylpolyglutamate synthase/dihydrofolate synthase [Defluviitaleaceae bacterium]